MESITKFSPSDSRVRFPKASLFLPMFEYRVLRVNNLPLFGNGGNIEEQLNALGREGWELVCMEWSQPITMNFLIFSTPKLHRERIFYLKRKQ